jgi:hydrogenase expression/formation protein HypC
MCLGVPGKIVEFLEESPLGMQMAKVSFGGIVKEICLAYVPEAGVGDYVIVHAGFALNVIDEEEAMEVFQMLEEMEKLAELEAPEAENVET